MKSPCHGEIVEGLSAERFLRQFVRAGRPVLIKNLVRDWRALEFWTPSYLARLVAEAGDVQVPLRSTPDDMPRMDLARIQQGRTSLLRILHECDTHGDRELYVPGLSLHPGTPMAADVDCPPVLSSVDVYASTVFLGRNTRGIGHFHPKTQALLCQIQGTKRIRMYPPSELKRSSMFPIWSDGFFQSETNYYADGPSAAGAACQIFDLQPGDALFIPLHWLHVAEGHGWSVSLTNWWRPSVGEWAISAGTGRALLGIALFAIRRRLQKQRSGDAPRHRETA
jgi:hypothetical protein